MSRSRVRQDRAPAPRLILSQAGREEARTEAAQCARAPAALRGFQDEEAPRDHKVTFCLQNYVTIVMNLELQLWPLQL